MEFTLRNILAANEISPCGLKRPLKLPAKEVIMLNDDMLSPVLKPREYRTEPSPYRKKESFELKRIEVVNSIEDGKFRERGIYPGVTIPVLKSLESNDKEGLVEQWKEKNQEYVYFIDTIDRNESKKAAQLFPNATDFSVGFASLMLGSGISTDEDRIFNNFSLIEFKKAYFDRWKTRSRFRTYDSASLLRLINST